MQADVVSLAVRELLPRFTAANPDHEVMKKLAAWDGSMAPERTEPLIMAAWWREFARALYGDELGERFRANWAARAVFLGNVLSSQPHWCDDTRTPQTESCERLLIDSLENALEDLQEPLRQRAHLGPGARGAPPPSAVHRRALARALLRYPRAERRRCLHGERRRDGLQQQRRSRSRTAMRPACGRSWTWAMRRPRVFIHSGGQSGHPLSSHYSDFAAPWARGEYVPMVTERRRVEADGVQRLVLVPRK